MLFAKNDLVMWTDVKKELFVGVVVACYPDGIVVQLSTGDYAYPYPVYDVLAYLGSTLQEFKGSEVDNTQVSILGDFQRRVVRDLEGNIYLEHVPALNAQLAAYGDALQLLKIDNRLDALILHLFEKMLQS